jgi:hypothetical protein
MLGSVALPEIRYQLMKDMVGGTMTDAQYKACTSNYGFLMRDQHGDKPFFRVKLGKKLYAKMYEVPSLLDDSSDSDDDL